jgi:large subunit ribosomal protein L32
MPVPKRRHSNSRTNKRRANWKIHPPTVATCSHCNQPKLPHRVCPNCGYYGEEQVIAVKEA